MPWDWTPETRARLAAYLADRGLTSGEITTKPIGDGHSNLTHLVSYGVRRRHPFHPAHMTYCVRHVSSVPSHPRRCRWLSCSRPRRQVRLSTFPFT